MPAFKSTSAQSALKPVLLFLALSAALIGAPLSALAVESAQPDTTATASARTEVEIPNDWEVGDTATYRFVRTRVDTKPSGTGRIETHWLIDIEVLEADDERSVHRWRFRPDPSHPATPEMINQELGGPEMLETLAAVAPELVIDAEGSVTAIRNLPDIKRRTLALMDSLVERRAPTNATPEQIAAVRKTLLVLIDNDAFITEQFIREARALYMFGGGAFQAGTSARGTEQRVSPIGNVPINVEVESRVGAISAEGTLPFVSIETIPSLSSDKLMAIAGQLTRGVTRNAAAQAQLEQQIAGLKATVRTETRALLKDGWPWPPTLTRVHRITADAASRTDTSQLELLSPRPAVD